MTAFLAVSQFIEATLKAGPVLAGGDIERSRERRMALDSDAAIRIYPQTADGQAAAVRGGFHRFQFDITVECLARAALAGPAAGDAEAAVDVLLQAVWQRLAAAAAPAGVHSLLDNPRVSWELMEAGDRAAAVAIFTFSVGLSTHNQTLALWSNA